MVGGVFCIGDGVSGRAADCRPYKLRRKPFLWFCLNWLGEFSIIFISLGILTWDGIIGILAIMGTVIQTIAFGNKKPSNIRLINLPTCFMWMAYNLHYSSVGGLCSDIFSLISIIIGIIRLDIPEYKRKKKV